MPRIPLTRTKRQFTGQYDDVTLKTIEELAIAHNCSMGRIFRALVRIGLEHQTLLQGTLFRDNEENH